MNLNLATRDRHHIKPEGMPRSKVAPRDHGKRARIEGVPCSWHLCEAMAVTERNIREPVSDLLDGEIDGCSPGVEEYIAVGDPVCNQHVAGGRVDILKNRS